MDDSWDRSLFDKELKSILDAKLPVSASKINALQSLAISHPKHHNYIVQCVVRFIETAPPDYRLAGLYVVDAISRTVQKQMRKTADEGNQHSVETEVYLRRFAMVLKDGALQGCFVPCSSKDKEKVKKTLDIWELNGVFTKETVDYIRQSFLNEDYATSSGNYGQNKQPTQHPNHVDSVQSTKVPEPVVDAASLLAKLSSISGGNLANLASASTSTTVSTPQASQLSPPQQQDKDNALPPALARLLGGIVSTPQSPSSQASAPVAPPPTVPIPVPTNTGVINNAGLSAPPPPQQQQPSMAATSDPRLRQFPQQSPPPRFQPNTNNVQQPPPRTRPSRWNNADDTRPIRREQPPLSSMPPSRDMMSPNSHSRPPPPSHPEQQLPGPIHDPSLQPGTIRVLTRTLFVGALPESYTQRDVAEIFEKYGRLGSIIVTRKARVKANAFIKFETRAGIEAALRDTANLRLEGSPVKVNWAYGFGPKKMFDYKLGESIIPLSELSENEKSSLVTAPVGGFQGQAVQDQMTIEEPEVAYRPEWKKDELNKSTTPNNRSRVHDGADDYYQQSRPKRRRFDQPSSPPPMGDMQQQQPMDPSLSAPAAAWMSNAPPMPMSMMPQSMSQLYAAVSQQQQQQQHSTPISSAEATPPFQQQQHPSQHVPYPDPY
ncbi:hypothetical protein RO3G_08120 [Lichtheimia corymbifera JMRC:FSU:9682]|uniref:Uncharacterized protein n=1 Tax=Lichtheimia corymbifera JMRC:FSU:9682 TaxID=1263082 RepID=A0A068RKY0_9FUNG|nr:hypothetical protein RO3G_08120 [Lichtheimia corymbifera JMRC:FSU:9682]